MKTKSKVHEPAHKREAGTLVTMLVDNFVDSDGKILAIGQTLRLPDEIAQNWIGVGAAKAA